MLFGLLLITTRFNEPVIKFNISSFSVTLKVFKSVLGGKNNLGCPLTSAQTVHWLHFSNPSFYTPQAFRSPFIQLHYLSLITVTLSKMPT